MRVLAIESSCDDTSVSITDNGVVKSNIISSQGFHSKYKGIVPELASRAHIKIISLVMKEALEKADFEIDDIDTIAVTTEPGLVGSLIVGSNFAKGLALRYNKPLIPINHLEGHIFSGCLQNQKVEFPFIALVVSGGHTALFLVKNYHEYDILGLTIDDAAGEAFDKSAILMDLGYPGGPVIDRMAKEGNPKAYDFPRSMIHSDNYNFSFSGLKTSIRYFISKEFNNNIPEEVKPDLCASIQAAIVDVLVHKSVKAAKEYKVNDIVIAGGVSANSGLRNEMTKVAAKFNINVTAPEISYCVDNAAMIGFLAEKKLEESSEKDLNDLTFRVNPSALRAKRKKK